MQPSITMASDLGREFVQFFKGSHLLALAQAIKLADEQGNCSFCVRRSFLDSAVSSGCRMTGVCNQSVCNNNC